MRPLSDTVKVIEKLDSAGSPPAIEVRGIVKRAIKTVVINSARGGRHETSCECNAYLKGHVLCEKKVGDMFYATVLGLDAAQRQRSALLAKGDEAVKASDYCKILKSTGSGMASGCIRRTSAI
jgi:hypothetical protein